MLTQCPSCQTVFRVTGTILKMGHGQVRCGTCRTQFDALECLLDDEDEDIPARETEKQPESQPEPESDPSIEARESDFAEDVTLEGNNIEISGVYRIPPEERPDKNVEQVVHEHVVIEREARRDAETETADEFEFDLSNQQSVSEQLLDPKSDDGEPVAAAAGHLLDDVDGQAKPGALRKRARHRLANPAHTKIAAELDELTFGTPDAQPRAKHTRWWIAASIALAVVLGLQAIHHHRDDLVRHPKLGPAVTRLYHAVGLTLQPQWELKAYELQQWGVLTDPAVPDTLRVRASITNRAAFPQPYPLIKLALQDRWGAPVGVRAFEPNEYLPATAPNGASDRLLAPKQRANAEIVIVDPGADAVGFQIHACLQYPQALVCSDDLPQTE